MELEGPGLGQPASENTQASSRDMMPVEGGELHASNAFQFIETLEL
jgi:hypothetical protein